MGAERILVTGASGFIGGHIATALAADGRSVRAQYRRPDATLALTALAERGTEIVRADLSDLEQVAEITKGVSGVIHAAAHMSDFGPYDGFHRINYQATVDLLESARDEGCRCFLYVSSISVHGFGPHVDTTEEGPYYPLRSNYQKTKKLAEDFVLSQTGTGMKCTAIRPGLVYGPGDHTTLGPVLQLLNRRVMPLIGGFRRLNCPVYIDDVVDGATLAFDSPESDGLVFNLTSGERTNLREPLLYASRLLGVPRPRLNIPFPVAFAAAALLESDARLIHARNAPILTLYRVAQLANDFHFSIDRACQVLGYKPRVGLHEGLRMAIESMRSGA